MCEKEATTVEHAPPQCLFPEKKDLPDGMDLRKKLITVPSCEEHNTKKSKDDEYLLYVLSLSITNNQTGLGHFITKVKRAYTRNPKIMAGIAKTGIPVTVKDSKTNSTNNTIAVQIDRNRVESSLEKTSRALYFSETKETFEGEIQIIPSFMLDMNDVEFNEQSAAIIKSIDGITANLESKGQNPEVFSYKSFVDKKNGSIIEMTFFGQTKAYAIMKHKK